MYPSEAKPLLGHLPAVTAVWVGGALGVDGLDTCSWERWKDGPWRKERNLGDSCLQPCAHPSGHPTLPATRGFWGMSQPEPARVAPGTHMAREVSQQVLGHVVTVEQSEDNPLQVLLVDEAILIEVCEEEAKCERKGGLPQPPSGQGAMAPQNPPPTWFQSLNLHT